MTRWKPALIQRPHAGYHLIKINVGENTRLGAGVTTYSGDGNLQQPIMIGQGATIAPGTTLIAPVKVGDGAHTAVGSVVTEDILPQAGESETPERAGKPRRKRG